MRFIVMHKVDKDMEAGAPPPPGIIEKMGELVGESIKSGVFQNGAGLHRSALRRRLEVRGGKRTVTKGPLTGKNELIASMAMVKARSIEAATEQAERYANVIGDVEIEIGPVVEPWDIGIMPKPEGDLPGRFLLLLKGNPPKEATRKAIAELEKTMRDEGVLLLTEELASSATGSRAAPSKKKREWTDGPFTESKELIAGFSIIQLPSKRDALEWADRYGLLLEPSEVEIRELKETSWA